MRMLEVRRPCFYDEEELQRFFRFVIKDTFDKEGISHLVSDMETEIEDKRNNLRVDFDTNGRERYFYVALHNDVIIGTIEYGPVSKLIHDLTNGALDAIFEIGTVFVHPHFQGHGVANVLLNAMFLTLQGKGVSEFCLDSGYSNAQKIWKKKFGEPTYLIPNYWGEGHDHMIWRSTITDNPIRFGIT